MRCPYSNFEFKDDDSLQADEEVVGVLPISDAERHLFVANALHLFGVDRVNSKSYGNLAYLKGSGAIDYHGALKKRLEIAIRELESGAASTSSQLDVPLNPDKQRPKMAGQEYTRVNTSWLLGGLFMYAKLSTYGGLNESLVSLPDGVFSFLLSDNQVPTDLDRVPPIHRVREEFVKDRYKWEYPLLAMHHSDSYRHSPNASIFASFLDMGMSSERERDRYVKRLEKVLSDKPLETNSPRDDDGDDDDDEIWEDAVEEGVGVDGSDDFRGLGG
ncbi:hypothetical protein P7C73_g6881, partial [Tremellales sp. Uapishka_1]